MKDIYEECQGMENDRFTIRLILPDDTEDLLKVYSDKKAYPIFNSDNCDDDFYYTTMERMQQAVDFWVAAYVNHWFVRWTIVDRKNNEAVGTIEALRRDSTDCYDGYGIIRIDLRSDYEKEEDIYSILGMLVTNMNSFFGCSKCITKAVPIATERIEALRKYGFIKSDSPLIGGDNGMEYFDYWVYNVVKC